MNTREPTAAEVRTADRFRRAIADGRPTIRGMLAGLNLLAQCEQFRRLQVDGGQLDPGFSPPMIGEGDKPAPQAVLDSWNKLESGLTELELKSFAAAIVPGPNGPDLNIYGPPPTIEAQETQGLGGWFVVAIVAAAAAYIVHAITDADKTRTEAKKLAYQYSDRLAAIDRKMAGAPAAVRDSYKALKASTNFRQEKSFLDQLMEGGKGLGIGAGAAIVGGLILFGMSRRDR